MNKTMKKLVDSKLLYYIAVALMAINILGYVSIGSVECVVAFALTTYVANHYTKNQTLDILAGIFVANIIFGCGRVKEGMESSTEGMEKLVSKLETEAKEIALCDDKDEECHHKKKAAAKFAGKAAKLSKEADQN